VILLQELQRLGKFFLILISDFQSGSFSIYSSQTNILFIDLLVHLDLELQLSMVVILLVLFVQLDFSQLDRLQVAPLVLRTPSPQHPDPPAVKLVPELQVVMQLPDMLRPGEFITLIVRSLAATL